MDATTIAVDLAKDVFEIACATSAGRIVERRRLSRPQFYRFLSNVPAGVDVVMEACSSAEDGASSMAEMTVRICGRIRKPLATIVIYRPRAGLVSSAARLIASARVASVLLPSSGRRISAAPGRQRVLGSGGTGQRKFSRTMMSRSTRST